MSSHLGRFIIADVIALQVEDVKRVSEEQRFNEDKQDMVNTEKHKIRCVEVVSAWMRMAIYTRLHHVRPKHWIRGPWSMRPCMNTARIDELWARAYKDNRS